MTTMQSMVINQHGVLNNREYMAKIGRRVCLHDRCMKEGWKAIQKIQKINMRVILYSLVEGLSKPR